MFVTLDTVQKVQLCTAVNIKSTAVTGRTAIFTCIFKKFYISSKYLLPPQRRLRSFLGVTLKGDLVEEADGGLRSCPIPF